MQQVSLADSLTFELADGLRVESPGFPLDMRDNTVFRAVVELRRHFQTSVGAHVTLTKRIPVGGGLGGGSSDAAASLVALSRLWGLDTTTELLAKLAEAIGSDVAFFLYGPTALIGGRGEQVTP